jgi:hypothetical protein
VWELGRVRGVLVQELVELLHDGVPHLMIPTGGPAVKMTHICAHWMLTASHSVPSRLAG